MPPLPLSSQAKRNGKHTSSTTARYGQSSTYGLPTSTYTSTFPHAERTHPDDDLEDIRPHLFLSIRLALLLTSVGHARPISRAAFYTGSAVSKVLQTRSKAINRAEAGRDADAGSQTQRRRLSWAYGNVLWDRRFQFSSPKTGRSASRLFVSVFHTAVAPAR